MFVDEDWREMVEYDQHIEYEDDYDDYDGDEYDRETEVELEHYWRE